VRKHRAGSPARAIILRVPENQHFAAFLRLCHQPVIRIAYNGRMSYSVTLSCGCRVYVACHPVRRVAHTRVIEGRGPRCRHRRHDVGAKISLWELLPDPQQPAPRVEYEPADA
jgi:hypothetical protein